MEVFMKGEDHGALRRRQYGDPQGDLDFGDVFGGPPRRFFRAAVEEEEEEKPVFGGKSAARWPRHLPGDRFFDDIFRGDDSSSWKMTRSRTQPFSSLHSRSSVPTFSRRPDVECKMMDGSSNGLSSPYSSSGSNETIQEHDHELRHETVHQIFPKSSFSKVEKDGRSNGNRYNFIAEILKEGGDYSKPKNDVKKQSQSCRWTAAPTEQRENHQVDEDDRSNQVYTSKKTLYSSESLRWDSMTLGEDSDDPFEDYFVELSDGLEQAPTPRPQASEDTKALDAKIGHWSAGKKGNIRSLLSTLQYVLWPGNEWKAIALVDLVEANPVKRAYQRALLHLHPDKLQQKGAASNHKYIAEKVFDILQEAWDHFNNVAWV